MQFTAPLTGKSRKIDKLTFGDDGVGMDATTLASCLKLGWSSRFNDRTGIGRFGVGMVLGGIHECQRIEVYSKQVSSESWLWTYIDLEEISAHQMEVIPEPKQKKLPKEYENLTAPNHGTLVIWSKYDRQRVTADKIIEDAHVYVGRTFRKFIWNGVQIKIDNEIVKAHDPLFLNSEKSQFPEAATGTPYDPFTINWPINDEKVRKEFGDTAEITIKMSLLPEELRPTTGIGGRNETKLRHINELQEGVSILREGREVFFGPIPYWSWVRTGSSKQNTWSFLDIDRWWGCEISFGAELDTSFEVKNIKRGARPEPELLQAIKEKISPTRRSAIEAVQHVWEKAKRDQEDEDRKKEDGLGRHESHRAVEIAAQKGVSTRSKYDADKLPDEVIEDHFDHFGINLEEKQKQRYKELFAAQQYTIIDDHAGWRGGGFWEVSPGGNKIVMQYNLQHEFFKELRALEKQITEEQDPNTLKALSGRITGLVNLLLVSCAKAESSYDSNQKFTTKDFIESLNQSWGINLNSFVKHWVEDQYGKENE